MCEWVCVAWVWVCGDERMGVGGGRCVSVCDMKMSLCEYVWVGVQVGVQREYECLELIREFDLSMRVLGEFVNMK